MSTIDIIIPVDLWEDDDQAASIVHWLYADGAQVKKGEILAELLISKVTLELEAPTSGTLRIVTPPEVPLGKGDVIGSITE